MESVRVTQVATGGAFGGKEDMSIQGQTALDGGTGRPSGKSARSRAKRAFAYIPSGIRSKWQDYKGRCDAEGRLLTAVWARMIGDKGA